MLCVLRVTSLTIGGGVGAGGGPRAERRAPRDQRRAKAAATLTINTNDGNVVGTTGLGSRPAPPGDADLPPTVIDPMCGVLCGTTLPATFTNTGQAEWIIDSVGSPARRAGRQGTTPPTAG